MVRIWRLYQGGGMGVGYLPDEGGVFDQSSSMLAAFAVMADFDAKLKDNDGTPLGEDGETDHQELARRFAASIGVKI